MSACTQLRPPCLNTKDVPTEMTWTHIRQAACSCLSDQRYTMTKVKTPEGVFIRKTKSQDNC